MPTKRKLTKEEKEAMLQEFYKAAREIAHKMDRNEQSVIKTIKEHYCEQLYHAYLDAQWKVSNRQHLIMALMEDLRNAQKNRWFFWRKI
jgi:hypothetical protein